MKKRRKSKIIVKRKNYEEIFNEKKVYGSVYAACFSAHYSERKCEKISEDILNKVIRGIKNKRKVTSSDIRDIINRELKKKSKELAFYYENRIPNLRKL